MWVGYSRAARALTRPTVPSLRACEKLTVEGAVAFSSRVRIVGAVKVSNPTDGPLEMPPGVYENEDVVLPCEPRAPPADEVRGGAGGRGGGGGGGLSYLFCCARLRADKPVAAQSGEVV